MAGDAINARRIVFRVLFLHMNLERLLVFIVPVAFRTLERLAAVARVLQHRYSRRRSRSSRQSGARCRRRRRGVHDHITFGTFDAVGFAVGMRSAAERRQSGNLTGGCGGGGGQNGRRDTGIGDGRRRRRGASGDDDAAWRRGRCGSAALNGRFVEVGIVGDSMFVV